MKASQLIRNYGFDETESMYRRGVMSEREWHRYQLAWTWCAFRVSNVCRAADKQDRFWKRFGKDAFYRRLNRVRRVCGFEPIKAV